MDTHLMELIRSIVIRSDGSSSGWAYGVVFERT